MDSAFFITSFVTLFVIVDPIGLMPLFVALTQGATTAQRRSIALRSCLTAALLLTLFAVLGEAVLGFIGISMPAFRVAGGALLFLTALDMLFERRSKRREDRTESEEFNDPSVFPMAIPLIAGPGSIATVILLAGSTPIPFKLLTITAGFIEMALVPFILASIAGRAFIFMLVGILFRVFGAPIKRIIDEYFTLVTTVFGVLFVGGFLAIALLGGGSGESSQDKCEQATMDMLR